MMQRIASAAETALPWLVAAAALVGLAAPGPGRVAAGVGGVQAVLVVLVFATGLRITPEALLASRHAAPRVALTVGVGLVALPGLAWAARACLLAVVVPSFPRAGLVAWVGMDYRGVISDETWAIIEPLLPSTQGKGGGRYHDHRPIVEGIAYRFRTGCPWRDVPVEFGPWQTLWKRHTQWSADGTWQRVLEALQGQADEAGELDWTVAVDSTVVRAHQHAAGARHHHTGGGAELHDAAGAVAA